jgi:hypothetical protein
MHFAVSGGNGENYGIGRYGFGELVAGSLAVQPGDLITAIAGGSASTQQVVKVPLALVGPLLQIPDSGAAAVVVRRSLSVNNNLIVVAGGGGGTGAWEENWVRNKEYYSYISGNDSCDAGQGGHTMTAVNSAGVSLSTAGGGQPGTLTSPGLGGTSDRSYTSTLDGHPGQGSAGADGVSTNTIASGLTHSVSSGSGGGGYCAGGSGSVLYWDRNNGNYITLGGDGGGGSNYVSSAVSGGSTNITSESVGMVIVSFS